MAKALVAFHFGGVLYDPEENPDVPADVARKVGSHLLDEGGISDDDQGDSDTPTFDGEAFDAAVEARAEEIAAERVTAAVEEYKAKEQAAYDFLADQEDAFDPSGEKVKATDVKTYLESLDVETVNGKAEFDRVVELEREGENRSSAIPA